VLETSLEGRGFLVDVMRRAPAHLSSLGIGLVLLLAAPYCSSVLAVSFFGPPYLQSTATLTGKVADQNNAVVSGAKVTAQNTSTNVERITTTDDQGTYQLAALPVGDYRVEIRAEGFKTEIVDHLSIEVARIVVQDFQLEVGDITQTISVTPDARLIETGTVSVGQVIGQQPVQELPLNGRQFIELGLLVPGSVTPPQNGFSTAPVRGLGVLTFNTAGNREDSVNFMINGITLNSPTLTSISFQPSLSTVREFRVDNSTFSAEYGHNSGAIVNIATRSGSNGFHGEVFNFFRNDWLDARNFFEFTTNQPAPYRRNQFGGNLGGPILKNRSFFFFSYEGLRQRQGLPINSLVLSDAQRLAATNPVTKEIIGFIPPANFIDDVGTARFVGSAGAPIDIDQWTIDIAYNIGEKDRIHGYYALQDDFAAEPTRFGNTIPNFGIVRSGKRRVFTLNETHTFGPWLVNEARLGFTRVSFASEPKTRVNPAELGFNTGINSSIGLPQINIAGGLNFGGPVNFPQGRGDLILVGSNTLSYLHGNHSFKFGGELRRYDNNNFRVTPGSFNVPSIGAFLSGTANSFSTTLGNQDSSIVQWALGSFVQDNLKWRSNVMLELGLRYEWNVTPTERFNRFIVFDPETVSLLRVGENSDQIYRQNNKNFEPRVGLAWDPFHDGLTSVRVAYAIQVDSPMTNVVRNTVSNPPLATPLTLTGTVNFDNALSLARAAGLAPQTVDKGFSNAYVQTWNLNVQRELSSSVALMAGYFGSKGTHLTLARNINQPVNGVRPYPALSPTSPILAGTALGNITQMESTGNSSYNALWISVNQRNTRGLHLNGYYTFSKSIDYNSLSTQGVVVQNSYDVRADRGLSDFDARHRVVVSGLYDLPFKGGRIREGWQLATIVQVQTGNPVNIITTNSTINGVPNTLRPDVTGPIQITGSVERWFDPSVFVPVNRFGNLGRNVVLGPGFSTADFSVIKNTNFSESLRLQFRAEFFDIFNHANFGQPGNVVGSANFGRITNTRFPTGDSGSSRQVQFALKLSF
jgi:hypothetical protein